MAPVLVGEHLIASYIHIPHTARDAQEKRKWHNLR